MAAGGSPSPRPAAPSPTVRASIAPWLKPPRISRLAGRVTSAERLDAATALRSVLAARRRAQDLLDVGAYKVGSNPLVDAAIEHDPQITAFLRQAMNDRVSAEESWARLMQLVAGWGGTP